MPEEVVAFIAKTIWDEDDLWAFDVACSFGGALAKLDPKFNREAFMKAAVRD